MREIDDAHDAEHEVETDTDQAEVQSEENACDQRIDQHRGVTPPSVQKTMRSWARINRLAGGDLVRIDRDELDVSVIVKFELSERRQLADLATRLVEFERSAQRLEVSGQAEHGAAQLQLIEAGRDRERLFDDEPGRVTGNRIEAEFKFAVGIRLVPGSAVFLQAHTEVDRIFQIRRRHVGEDVLEALGADILLEKLLLEACIDRKRHLELDADVGDVAQEGNVVRGVAEMNHRVRLRVGDVVDDDGVV